MTEKLTQEILKKHLSYDKDTGIFTWLDNIDTKKYLIGKTAGTKDNGYIRIGLYGKIYRAHRLAWLYMNGEFPERHIDHINGIRDDNRFVNLREASNHENGMNTSIWSTNTSGYRGVYKRRDKWQTSIIVNGIKRYLGTYDTPELASEKYEMVAKELQGEFYRE